MKHRTRILATAVAALLAATVVAAPASADKARYADPADATASLTDLRSVVVDHRASQLVVKVRFTDLRRRSSGGPSGLTMLLDTRPRPGGRRVPAHHGPAVRQRLPADEGAPRAGRG